MFTNFYWLMPVGKFGKIWNRYFELSIQAITGLQTHTGNTHTTISAKYPQQGFLANESLARSIIFICVGLPRKVCGPNCPGAQVGGFIERPQPCSRWLEILKEVLSGLCEVGGYHLTTPKITRADQSVS